MNHANRSSVRMRDKLVTRMTILIGFILLAVSAVSSFFGMRSEQAALYAELQRHADQLAHILSASSANPLLTFEMNALEGIVAPFTKDSAVKLIEIRDKNAKVLKSAGDGNQQASLILARNEVKAGGEVVGSVLIGLSDAPVRQAVTGARIALILREGIGLLILFLLMAWQLRRRVETPLDDAVSVANRIAKGDLDGTIDAKGRKDEFGVLLAALQTMQSNLARLVQDTRDTTITVVDSATQVSAGSSNLSARTESQASTLEETAASMEQITNSARETAANTKLANDLAQKAAGVARSGGSVVANAVEKISAIQESSKRIGEIIGVIDSIAFQTNILALNAAVEAARAGEQGRGFAVVASEVRALAQRSATAAREIKELIGASATQVEAGTALIRQAGTAMTDIVGANEEVVKVIGNIANATSEQAGGIEQINSAVAQMEIATQQNAALVEEAAAAAESMRERAQMLQTLVERFKLTASHATLTERIDAAPAVTTARLAERRAAALPR